MTQANVNVAAPGFLGINTEDSPTNLPLSWCAVADNSVIDANGRIASRKGYRILTATPTLLGTAAITNIHEARYADGTVQRFCTANNKIFTFSTAGVLTDITPAAATITADDWHICTLNDDTFFFQRGHEAIVYDNSVGSAVEISDHASVLGTPPQGDIAMSAYGRVWVAGVQGSRAIVYWSDLLIGAAWSGGTSGSLDLTNIWPTGNDQVVAIAAHNQKLLIFGSQSILVFGSQNADGRLSDPAADLLFEDGIVDIGCVSKRGWTVVGSDLWFIDYTGLRSLGRTIQEKSLPIGDISRNINTIFRNQARTADTNSRLFYSPDDAMVLAMFTNQRVIWCFDTRQKLEDGSARVTRWVSLPFVSVARSLNGTVWWGDARGISEYAGYVDAALSDGTGGRSFRMRYYQHPQNFGQDYATHLKVPKEVDFVIGGGLGQRAVCHWGYGYTNRYLNQPFTLDSTTPDFYNIDEFNITTADDPDDPTEYGSGGVIGEYTIPLSGSGERLSIGLEANVRGEKLSIQEINIQTKIGRML